MIDDEVREIINTAYERTKEILTEHEDALEAIAQELLEKEVIFKDDLVRLIGQRPFPDPTFHPDLHAKNGKLEDKTEKEPVPERGEATDEMSSAGNDQEDSSDKPV